MMYVWLAVVYNYYMRVVPQCKQHQFAKIFCEVHYNAHLMIPAAYFSHRNNYTCYILDTPVPGCLNTSSYNMRD